MNPCMLLAKEDALPGREQNMFVTNSHYVSGRAICGPFAKNLSKVMFGLGCFWGAEKKFWLLDGVFSTAVGYAAGHTRNPKYDEVCSGLTGHNEVVLVVYDAGKIEFIDLLKCFWESHDPTQGMRQGNDVGTQYRSGIYVYDEDQLVTAEKSQVIFQALISQASGGQITTEIGLAPDFYYAEDYHQQYLAKNPGGYCGLGGTGLVFNNSESKSESKSESAR